MRIQIQFVEEGCDENPFAPRSWSFVPRIGDFVVLPETRRTYRVLAVEWRCMQRSDGTHAENEPLVMVHIAAGSIPQGMPSVPPPGQGE